MFGLGLTEILVIVVIIIVVIKPEDLPHFFKKVGKSYGEVKKTYSEVNKMKDDFINIAETDIKKVAGDQAKKALTQPTNSSKKA